jgi:hypothetical protein
VTAQALGVSVRELRPDAVADDGDPARPTDLDGLRLHLSGHPALARLFATDDRRPEPIGLERLRHQVDEARTLAHDSRFAALNDALTDLLRFQVTGDSWPRSVPAPGALPGPAADPEPRAPRTNPLWVKGFVRGCGRAR